MPANLPPRPIVENAPGLVWRPSGNEWEARWLARYDLAQRGYRPRIRRLWKGVAPTDKDRQWIADNCIRLQGEMLAWGRGVEAKAVGFTGTIRSLAEAYTTDEDSSYRKLRFHTRKNHDSMLKRIVADYGDHTLGAGYSPTGEPTEPLKARTMLRWHEEWSKRGTTTAHGLMGMLRTLFGFGASFLEDAECERLCTVMSRMKFKQGGHRDAALTAEQAIAIRAKAHELGFHSIALAQALQFECTLRQKDIIGEWVPQREPGTSDVLRDEDKWLKGLRWSEVDQNMILKHVTSKRNKEVAINLTLAPMVMEELALMFGDVRRELLPTSGPMIVDQYTSLPYAVGRFRRKWREVATAAGVPANVCNMDTRAGAITEATDVASLEDARHAATHSNISMTQRYSREAQKRIAKVMTLRVEGRKNKSET